MRFLLDENLPRGVVDLFGQTGHEAVQIFNETLAGQSDAEVDDLCRRKQYCLVTMDLDFAKVGADHPEDHPGIIIVHLQNQGLRCLLTIVPRLLLALKYNTVRGRLWVVERNGIRVRLDHQA